eukprot:CAMPEP_0203762566 /NCGR_PEP_ID=MMETSP0098-20131031/15420_1 /ASSEMBLY_ACC=CAM_ASM_000208 /TAXON_ID=96639 /ORGANISM=" , Strain NY0313808BC1" /LENGTH=1105 /DNA_ID=CAMNT_0050657021 /DNA_START=310 /DNA_END=3624 /DNA_ORIENTATION=+
MSSANAVQVCASGTTSSSAGKSVKRAGRPVGVRWSKRQIKFVSHCKARFAKNEKDFLNERVWRFPRPVPMVKPGSMNVNVEDYFLRQVIIWEPEQIFKGLQRLRCPYCQKECMNSDEWTASATQKRVLDMKNDLMIVYRRLRCAHCNGLFSNLDKALLDVYPTYVRAELGVVWVGEALLTWQLSEFIFKSFSDLGAEKTAAMLNRFYEEEVEAMRVKYNVARLENLKNDDFGNDIRGGLTEEEYLQTKGHVSRELLPLELQEKLTEFERLRVLSVIIPGASAKKRTTKLKTSYDKIMSSTLPNPDLVFSWASLDSAKYKQVSPRQYLVEMLALKKKLTDEVRGILSSRASGKNFIHDFIEPLERRITIARTLLMEASTAHDTSSIENFWYDLCQTSQQYAKIENDNARAKADYEIEILSTKQKDQQLESIGSDFNKNDHNIFLFTPSLVRNFCDVIARNKRIPLPETAAAERDEMEIPEEEPSPPPTVSMGEIQPVNRCGRSLERICCFLVHIVCDYVLKMDISTLFLDVGFALAGNCLDGVEKQGPQYWLTTYETEFYTLVMNIRSRLHYLDEFVLPDPMESSESQEIDLQYWPRLLGKLLAHFLENRCRLIVFNIKDDGTVLLNPLLGYEVYSKTTPNICYDAFVQKRHGRIVGVAPSIRPTSKAFIRQNLLIVELDFENDTEISLLYTMVLGKKQRLLQVDPNNIEEVENVTTNFNKEVLKLVEGNPANATIFSYKKASHIRNAILKLSSEIPYPTPKSTSLTGWKRVSTEISANQRDDVETPSLKVECLLDRSILCVWCLRPKTHHQKSITRSTNGQPCGLDPPANRSIAVQKLPARFFKKPTRPLRQEYKVRLRPGNPTIEVEPITAALTDLKLTHFNEYNETVAKSEIGDLAMYLKRLKADDLIATIGGIEFRKSTFELMEKKTMFSDSLVNLMVQHYAKAFDDHIVVLPSQVMDAVDNQIKYLDGIDLSSKTEIYVPFKLKAVRVQWLALEVDSANKKARVYSSFGHSTYHVEYTVRRLFRLLENFLGDTPGNFGDLDKYTVEMGFSNLEGNGFDSCMFAALNIDYVARRDGHRKDDVQHVNIPAFRELLLLDLLDGL